jgi:hypothetical protein
MKRDRSNLSRDELGLLLSVCLQRAEEEIKRLKKRLAPIESHKGEVSVTQCAEPGCSAMRVTPICDGSMRHIDCRRILSCYWHSACNGAKWCDRHAEGGFFVRDVACNEHSRRKGDAICNACLPIRGRTLVCDCTWVPYVNL